MSRPLRIMHVLSNFMSGGAETNTARLVTALAARGFRQTIVCLTRHVCPALASKAVLPIRVPPKSRRIAGSMVFLRSVVREFAPDVIHGRAYRTWRECGSVKALVRPRPRLVQSFHGATSFDLEPHRRRVSALCLRGLTDAYLTVSEDLALRLAGQWHIPSEMIRVIRNGIDTEQFRPACDRSAAKARLGIDQQTLVVGSVGSLRRVKNQALLIRACAELFRNLRSGLLMLVGDGPLRRTLLSMAEHLDIAGQVRFVGYQAVVQPSLAAMDIFVQPSFKEGSPTAVLEAMACGLPVVAARSTGCAELHAQAGLPLLVGADDAPALARQLRTLALDERQRQRLGQRGRAVVVESFGLQRMVNAYEGVYRALANTEPSPHRQEVV